MSHQELAITFCTTAASIKNNCPRDLTHEEVCRSVYSRLYYALYHKYLEHDLSLASSKQSSKHEEIKRRIGANYNIKTIQLYRKMYDLRIWADYKLTNHPDPGATNALSTINVLILQISAFIKQQNFQ